MNFEEFWETSNIWQYDPYISDNPSDIEKRCAEYGWSNCKQEILKIVKNQKYYTDEAGDPYIYRDWLELKIKEL